MQKFKRLNIKTSKNKKDEQNARLVGKKYFVIFITFLFFSVFRDRNHESVDNLPQ
nr:MAG TPA: hypothetical protein [Caudoviricetes sp.]